MAQSVAMGRLLSLLLLFPRFPLLCSPSPLPTAVPSPPAPPPSPDLPPPADAAVAVAVAVVVVVAAAAAAAVPWPAVVYAVGSPLYVIGARPPFGPSPPPTGSHASEAGREGGGEGGREHFGVGETKRGRWWWWGGWRGQER